MCQILKKKGCSERFVYCRGQILDSSFKCQKSATELARFDVKLEEQNLSRLKKNTKREKSVFHHCHCNSITVAITEPASFCWCYVHAELIYLGSLLIVPMSICLKWKLSYVVCSLLIFFLARGHNVSPIFIINHLQCYFPWYVSILQYLWRHFYIKFGHNEKRIFFLKK